MDAMTDTDPSHPSHLVEGFVAMREAGELIDYTIRGSDESFSIHSLVLASMSPVFKKMLMHMSSQDESEKRKETFPTIPDDIVKKIIDFSYTGSLTFTNDDLMPLISAAHFLQMSALLKFCKEQVSAVLQPSNCFSWIRIANLFQLETILPPIQKMMFTAHKEVIQSEEFQDAKMPEIVLYLGSLLKKGIHSDFLLKAALNWIKHDSPNRSVHMRDLFACVSFDQCTRSFLSTVVEENSELLDTQPNIYKLILKGTLTGVGQRDEGLMIFGGQSNDNMPNNDIWMLEQDHLVKYAEGPGQDLKAYHSMCQVPQGVMLTGGIGSDMCKLFDVARKIWINKANLLSKRLFHGSGCLDLKVFVIGGQLRSGISDKSVDYLDLERNAWAHGPDIPTAADLPKVAVCKSKLYLLLPGDGILYCLDSGCSSWIKKSTAELAAVTYGCSMTAFDDWIFVSGGNKDIHYMYVPHADTWCRLTEPCLTERHGALVSYKQKLYLIAGCKRDDTLRDVHEYDIMSDSWSLAPWKLPTPLWLHAAFVVTM